MAQKGIQRRTRQSLKMIFQKGKLPTEANFGDLIDSMVNIIDDGINKSQEFGYEISPQGESKSLLSFFENLEHDKEPIWQYVIRSDETPKGIAFANKNAKNALFFSEDGKIGVRTAKPVLPFAVNGFVGMKGRIGMYQVPQKTASTVPNVHPIAYADGKYHDIISGIKESMAFEIVAKINGPKGRGKQAMTHATAVCTHWSSFFNKVRQTNAFFGWPWNRIKLRWKKNKETKTLSLQIKTRSHFGHDAETGSPLKIKFHITQLWNEEYLDKLSNPI